LESVCWGNSTVGSNPTLSAISQVGPSNRTSHICATECDRREFRPGIPGARHGALRRRSRHRRVRCVRRFGQLGGERRRSGSHLGEGGSHQAVAGAYQAALPVPTGGSLRGFRQHRGRSQLCVSTTCALSSGLSALERSEVHPISHTPVRRPPLKVLAAARPSIEWSPPYGKTSHSDEPLLLRDDPGAAVPGRYLFSTCGRFASTGLPSFATHVIS
jgi:hypothetical protein